MAEYKSNYTGEQIDQAIAKANTALQEELEPSFNASASKNITSQDITNWNNKAEISDIPDLTNYELKVSTANNILMTLNNTTYELTLSLRNSANEVLNTQSVDLPLETMVVDGHYDNVNKKIVLELESGSTIDVPVGDLINGLQSEITSSNKLDASLVDDSLSTNKFTNATEKAQWTGKYDKPSTGIPKTDLAQAVQDSLNLADSAIQDITGKEDKTNKVTSLDSTSTDTQYPSAKSVWDLISGLGGDIIFDDYSKFSRSVLDLNRLKKGVYLWSKGSKDGYSLNGTNITWTMLIGPLLVIVPEDIDVNNPPSTNTNVVYILGTGTSAQSYKLSQMIITYNTNGNLTHNITTISQTNFPGFSLLIDNAQTFVGVKTFSSFPVGPSSAPTSNYQFANKKYVDDQITAMPTTYTGYDATKTQVLKNINGTLTWVDE